MCLRTPEIRFSNIFFGSELIEMPADFKNGHMRQSEVNISSLFL